MSHIQKSSILHLHRHLPQCLPAALSLDFFPASEISVSEHTPGRKVFSNESGWSICTHVLFHNSFQVRTQRGLPTSHCARRPPIPLNRRYPWEWACPRIYEIPGDTANYSIAILFRHPAIPHNWIPECFNLSREIPGSHLEKFAHPFPPSNNYASAPNYFDVIGRVRFGTDN